MSKVIPELAASLGYICPSQKRKNRTKGEDCLVTCLVDKFDPHNTCQSALHGIECWGDRDRTLGLPG